MSFGAAVAPLVLEGNYSTWSLYDTQNDTDVGDPGVYDTFAIVNRSETEALFHHNDFVKKYDIAAKSLGPSLLTPYYSTGLEAGEQISTKSVYGTYMVILATAQDEFHILKNGAIVETITASDLGVSSLLGVSISPKGKYIVVVAENKWIVLVGS